MTILPNRWRGKRLPEFVIKDLITKAQAKKQAKLEAVERRKKFLASYKPTQFPIINDYFNIIV